MAGKHWTTTWYLEPQVETPRWKLGDAVRGKLDTERLSGLLGIESVRRDGLPPGACHLTASTISAAQLAIRIFPTLLMLTWQANC